MLWLQTYIMWKIGSCFCTYEHVAHDSESNYAVLEENSLSYLHRCNSLDLYSIDVWSLILTFCKKKKKETISKHVMKCGLHVWCEAQTKHETVNQKHTLYDILVRMMNSWIMHTATARGKRCVLALIISLGFFKWSERTNPGSSNWKHMSTTL